MKKWPVKLDDKYKKIDDTRRNIYCDKMNIIAIWKHNKWLKQRICAFSEKISYSISLSLY